MDKFERNEFWDLYFLRAPVSAKGWAPDKVQRWNTFKAKMDTWNETISKQIPRKEEL